MRTLATYAVLLTATLATGAIIGDCARAQVSGYSMDMGGGWYRHSFSDGTTVYSMPMGDGWQRHSFSDGTTGYTMPMDAPAPPSYNYLPAIVVPPLDIAPLEIAPLRY